LTTPPRRRDRRSGGQPKQLSGYKVNLDDFGIARSSLSSTADSSGAAARCPYSWAIVLAILDAYVGVLVHLNGPMVLAFEDLSSRLADDRESYDGRNAILNQSRPSLSSRRRRACDAIWRNSL
jgi:hypothetical protein